MLLGNKVHITSGGLWRGQGKEQPLYMHYLTVIQMAADRWGQLPRARPAGTHDHLPGMPPASTQPALALLSLLAQASSLALHAQPTAKPRVMCVSAPKHAPDFLTRQSAGHPPCRFGLPDMEFVVGFSSDIGKVDTPGANGTICPLFTYCKHPK